MKRNLMLLFVGASMVMACQQNQIDVQQMEDDVFYAAIENDDQTRTTLDENNNVMWSANDQLTIFKKSSINSKYQVTSSSAGKTTGTFTKVYAVNDDEFTAGGELDHNVAVYPYQEQLAVSRADDADLASRYEIEGMVLPEEQEYVANSFAEGAFPMAAVSLNNELVFRNVCGGIKLQLKGTQKVTSIKIQGNDKEKLAGNAVLTVYADEDLKPALTMASDAVKSVTLDCGDGVQLTESSATEFIIALPPVLFSKGFTATVTASDGQTYTVQTDKANTVLRSSLLVMPVFDLNKGPESGESTYIEILYIDKSSIVMAPGVSYTFVIDYMPTDVANKTLTWSSSTTTVAQVDQSGTVTALSSGICEIKAKALGGASASVTVFVKDTGVADRDYIDEYGVNHGKGIGICGVIWAPVNCGYKAPEGDKKGFPYGKLYQWGRKYGQGYSSEYAELEPEIIEGPVMPSVGQSEAYSNIFISCEDDWSIIENGHSWNDGTESKPIKSANDPCPTGWRVPTKAEIKDLIIEYESVEEGMNFYGNYTNIPGAPKLYLPQAGRRYTNGDIDSGGYYWSSYSKLELYYHLHFNGRILYTSGSTRDYGEAWSVRCVQE